MPDYNDMGMVDPRGRFYSTDGLSHPDWAHRNRALVGFRGTKDIDFRSTDDEEEATFDDEGQTALDAFKDEGWIRVKPDQGIEVSGVHAGNISLIKSVLRSMARGNEGRSLYVDDGDGSKRVDVSMTGRPDFSAIDAVVRRDRHRYGG